MCLVRLPQEDRKCVRPGNVTIFSPVLISAEHLKSRPCVYWKNDILKRSFHQLFMSLEFFQVRVPVVVCLDRTIGEKENKEFPISLVEVGGILLLLSRPRPVPCCSWSV